MLDGIEDAGADKDAWLQQLKDASRSVGSEWEPFKATAVYDVLCPSMHDRRRRAGNRRPVLVCRCSVEVQVYGRPAVLFRPQG